ncbi:hypothetical protein O3S80_14660 [Streptomyces sp. Lzd4kr]|nr:hypothetical protein [Streptomyces sp. Lzd4kr]
MEWLAVAGAAVLLTRLDDMLGRVLLAWSVFERWCLAVSPVTYLGRTRTRGTCI